MKSALRLATIGVAVALGACSNRPPDDDARSYVADIAAARAEKDAAFNSGPPVPESRRAELLPLAYFPIDPDYRVAATLKPSGNRDTMHMPTSTGGLQQMRRIGTLGFALKGQPLTLTAFLEVGAPDLSHLFVPFTDLTTGTETYAAGRYLDLDRNATGIYIIDFNLAYHPYCYYSPLYECPYPPAENRLKAPIRAGETLKK